MTSAFFRRVAMSFACAALSACSTSTTATDDATTDDASAASAACDAAAEAQCARRDACTTNHWGIVRAYGDLATCTSRVRTACLASLAATGTGASPASVSACAAAYPMIACADIDNGALPAVCQPPPGALPLGAACHFHAQCQSAYCRVPTGAECGACADEPVAGDACDGPDAATGCGGRGLVCVGATTAPYAAGACVAWATSAGASCDAGHPCGAGLSCTPVAVTATNRTCQPAAQLGEACGGASHPGCDTARGLTCNQTSHTCVPFAVAQAGAPCGLGPDGTAVRCAASGACAGETTGHLDGTCMAAAVDGAACDRVGGPDCLPLASCVTSGGSTAGTCETGSSSCH